MLKKIYKIRNCYCQRFSYDVAVNSGMAEYCLGSVLFFGIGINAIKSDGICLLKKAVDLENNDAMHVLLKIYESDDEFRSDSKMLNLLMMFSNNDSDACIKAANCLLDGIGCETNKKNDQKAFELLKSSAEKGDKIAINNLAWMYKNGRGCKQNYELSLILFELSSKLQVKSSYYHLGDIYENGLGVQKDLQKAIEYYRQGMELGNEKAKERFLELS